MKQSNGACRLGSHSVRHRGNGQELAVGSSQQLLQLFSFCCRIDSSLPCHHIRAIKLQGLPRTAPKQVCGMTFHSTCGCLVCQWFGVLACSPTAGFEQVFTNLVDDTVRPRYGEDGEWYADNFFGPAP